ncbi:MAG: hypothetical protein ACYSRP_08730 [Planctomycetota bacterium]
MEEKFGEVIKGIVIPDRVVEGIIRVLEENQRDGVTYRQATLRRAKTEYNSLERKIDMLLEDRFQGKIPEDLCYQKVNQFRSR